MKLADTLDGLEKLAFDTVSLIYFIEKHPKYFDQMLFIMNYVDSGRITGIAASIALTEVLVLPMRQNDTNLVKRYDAILTNSNNFRLVDINRIIARRAADLRARYNLRTPDALHIATAIESACDAFLSNDVGMRRITEISVLLLDELELPDESN